MTRNKNMYLAHCVFVNVTALYGAQNKELVNTI